MAMAVLFWPGLISPVRGEEPLTLIEKTATGVIDWRSGRIRATGFQAPEDITPGETSAERRLLSGAREAARRNLLAVLAELRVDSAHRLGELYAHDSIVMPKIRQMVKNAQAVNQRYLIDGTAAVTLELSMKGGFAQLVLPDEIKQIESIKTVSPERSGAIPDRDAPAGGATGSYTGLVVDARGLRVSPTLYPRIYDESGQEIYGSAFASREFAVQYGLVLYEDSPDAAVLLPRVADRPLMVKGLRTTQPGLTDIIISNADASAIRSRSDHLAFLKKCRVVIVIDPIPRSEVP